MNMAPGWGGGPAPPHPAPGAGVSLPTSWSAACPGEYAGRVPRYPRRPAPEPLDTNATPVVLIGTALWVVAGLLLLSRYHRFVHAGHGWLLWTCLAGFVVGAALYGYEHHRRRRRAVPPVTDP